MQLPDQPIKQIDNTKLVKKQYDMKQLRKRCKAVIDSCTTIDQMKGAYNYISLAGLSQDPITEAWFEFKLSLIGNI